MVQGERWGVSSYSTDPATARAALDYFGQFRAYDEWSGTPRR